MSLRTSSHEQITRIKKLRNLLHEKNAGFTFDFSRRVILFVSNQVVLALTSSRRQFTRLFLPFNYNGVKYRYFYHSYNETWNCERAVEIPIICREVRKYNAKQILEVGNVLSHYFPLHHDVVDKHETGINVLNKDIVEFQPEKKYDLIISISTLEHIGFNEEMYSLPESAQEVVPSPTYVARPEKILRVIQHLKRLLSDDGKIIVTIPWGFNKALDQLLKDDSDMFTSTFYVKRISETNRWVETEKELILNAKYHSPFPFANVLVIGVFQVP